MKKAFAHIASLLICIGAQAQGSGLLIEAVQAYSDGNYTAAKASLELLHAKDSTDDATLYYLGMCEYHTGDFENSEKHLSAAVALDSTNTWYLNSLASLYNASGRMDDAARLCEKLVALSPQNYRNSYTLCLIADSKMRERQDSLAEKYYKMALDVEPDYAPAQLGYSEAMRIRGNYPAYFNILGEFISNGNVNPAMKSRYMNALMENMDAKFWWVWGEQVSKLMDRCVELHPEDIQSRINKAQIHIIKGDRDAMAHEFEAIVPLATAQKDTVNLLMALSTIGDWYHEDVGDRRKAYAFYETALKIDPEYAPVLNNYAYFLSEERKSLKKALKMSTIVVRTNPDNATYLDTHAWILHLLGRDREAKPFFKHAMIYGGKDSEVILEHYSTVLRALGETDLADYYKRLADARKQ